MSNPEYGKLAERMDSLPKEKRALMQQRLAARRPVGYDIVAQSLRECGLTHIYGVAGLPTEQILPACDRQQIRPIGVYHHTSSVCMATAQNYQSGGLVAAALVSAGPAITNAMTGILVARDNGWPVIVLGGSRTFFQRFDVLPMISHLTKHAIAAPSTGSINECIQRACQIAVSGRPGPVYVDLHEDVLTGRADAAPVCVTRPVVPERALTATNVEIERVAAALLSAQNPALLLGKGIRWAGTEAPAQIQDLIETLGLPFITSPMGRGFISDDHPLCFNHARSVLQSQADVVLILGARLNWVFRLGAELSRDTQVFQVDVHQSDEDQSAIQTDFVHADAGDFVSRLVNVLKSRQDEVSDIKRQQHMKDWHNTLQTVSDETQRLLDRRMDSNERPMSPYRMMKEVREALPRNSICITEGNVSMMSAQPVIPAFLPASRMDAGTNACMGVGIPFAIGAKVACPDRPVVAVSGDYGFSLSAMEMEVCVRHGIPIVVVVANNQGNNGALKQNSYFPGDNSDLVTMFQPGLEYDQMMKMFGGQGETITDPSLLKSAVKKAIAADKPCCINVVIDSQMPLPNAWGQQSAAHGGGDSG